MALITSGFLPGQPGGQPVPARAAGGNTGPCGYDLHLGSGPISWLWFRGGMVVSVLASQREAWPPDPRHPLVFVNEREAAGSRSRPGPPARPARPRADVEDDNGDGWTLLRRAIHAEHARGASSCEPLHAAIARDTNSRHQNPDRAPAVTEAGQIGHRLAAEIIHAWSERNTLDDAGDHATTPCRVAVI